MFSTTRRRALPALLAAAVLGLTGCATSTSSTGGGGGPGVEPGADMATYVAALADMEPVTLVMQSTAPQGAATGRRFEEYAAAVQEWSGGKITFDIAYANAIAPPAQVDDAIADSRIDVGSVIVALDPSTFPANNVLWDLSFLGSQEPVEGLLSWHGMMIQAALSNPEIQAEFEDNGMHALLPTFGSGSYFVQCTEPGADLGTLSGRTIASQSRIQNLEAEGLGMTPSTVSYAEMFESLERGVVDCAVSTMTVSSLGGFIPAAPHFAYDGEVGLAAPGGTIAIGLDRWESLPLAARQLLHDRTDVILNANFQATWENVAAGLASIAAEGGEVGPLGADAVAALRTANERALADATNSTAMADAPGFVQAVQDAQSEWDGRVADLGIAGIDVDYAGFPAWVAAGVPDIQPYFDELAEVMSSARPTEDGA